MKFGKYNKRQIHALVYYLAILICISSIKCSSRIGSSKKEGYVVKTYRMKYTGSNDLLIPDYFPDFDVWFKDNFIIERIPVIQIVESSKGASWKAEDHYYTFVDLGDRNYFRYSSFTDTASILQCCYTTTDSLGIAYGWNFFYCEDSTKMAKPDFLSDTSIDGVQYKRAVFYKSDSTGQKKPRKIYYLDLGRVDTLFTLNHTLTHAYKHPVTRVEYFLKNLSINQEFVLIEQINFKRGTLSDGERKVFRKWIKIAKKNPVKYNATKDSIYSPPIPNNS